ncbi:hypothetical protein B0A49_01896 [Cryomyces minteri]|uniref:Uncharacterized protein n=1 Tax=Cryomyces minteri TaxID=331657 RepID=A0A4U0XS86_9PEZI|nr:hypothetical protein B0A49_01896 [Cryomyces minteri]
MCQDCSSSMSLNATTGIAWGIPVDVARLGTHLEVYLQMKSTIAALRLSHRFGRGSEAHITTLPTEIVGMIEEELIKQPRWDAYVSWTKASQCFQETCRPRDHFTEEEIQGIMDDMGVDSSDSDTESEPMDSADKFLGDDPDLFWGRHMVQKERWRALVCQHTRARGNFVKYDEILESDFGLEAFITHKRRTEGLCLHSIYLTETTVSYIILPTKFSRKTLEQDEGDWEEIYSAETNNAVLVETSSLSLTKAHRARFVRAMKVLDLEPFSHIEELQETISAYSPKHSRDYLNAVDPVQTATRDEKAREIMRRQLLDKAARRESKSTSQLLKGTWPKLIVLVALKYLNWV